MSNFAGRPGQRPYNGFSPVERARKSRAVKAAIAEGAIIPSHTCSVCAMIFSHPVGQHSEDYSDLLAVYHVCRQCHYAIHIRFWRPDYWLAYIARFDPKGWYQSLSRDPGTLSRPFAETYPFGLAR